MPVRRPLVVVNGSPAQLPASDSLQLSTNQGYEIWDSGTPVTRPDGSALVGSGTIRDRWYNTFMRQWFYYDSALLSPAGWVSEQVHIATVCQSGTISNAMGLVAIPGGSSDLLVISMDFAGSASSHSAGNNFTVRLNSLDTSSGTVTLGSNTTGTTNARFKGEATAFAFCSAATLNRIQVDLVRNGASATISGFGAQVRYHTVRR